MSRLLEHHENCTLQDPMIRRETALAMRRAPRMSPRVYFTPWIGPHYGWKNTALSAARLLVLGASHYEWCEACAELGTQRDRSLTCWSVAELVVPERTNSFAHWRKIENAILGYEATDDKRQEMWRSIAYCNAVQKLVGYGARIAPTKEMWLEARRVFVDILECLRPSVVLVLGKQLWIHLPDDEEIAGHALPSRRAGGKTMERWLYRSGRNECRALLVPHPSAGLGATWHGVIEKELQL
jgi:hypothetical protein